MSRTIRAYTRDDFVFGAGALDITVALQDVDDMGIASQTHAVLAFPEEFVFDLSVIRPQWHFRTQEEQGQAIQIPHVLRLPEGVGQALLEALSRHYHGAADLHQVRADYLYERERRAKAEDRIHQLAQAWAGQRWAHLPGAGGGGGLGGQGGQSST